MDSALEEADGKRKQARLLAVPAGMNETSSNQSAATAVNP
jgi:hypothetical protein